MVVWSSIISNATKQLVMVGKTGLLCPRKSAFGLKQRMMSGDHRQMNILPSRWQWHVTKDLLHYYFWVGMIPVSVIVFLTNIFIGPATLTEIPEGYEPKHWEYYRHPITRFYARYLLNSPQQEYEKYLHLIYEEDEKRKIRKLEYEIKKKMKERHDYQAFYYRPMPAKYYRRSKEEYDEFLKKNE